MGQISTAAALTGLANGDGSPWAMLVDRHGQDVWRIVSCRLRDQHDADDVYQEFWLNLPRTAAGFTEAAVDRDGRKARAWLLRVAYNAATDRLRRRRPVREMPEDLPADEDPSMDSASAEERRHLMRQVQTAIDAMPEAQRRPLVLHIVGGLSYEDLAADLDCTVNNARVKVHRALKRLREILGVGEDRLSDQTLASLMVPALLTPALPALPAVATATTAGGGASAGATGATTATAAGPLAVIVQAPVLIGLGSAAVIATVATAVVVANPSPSPPPQPPHREAMPDLRPAATLLAAAGSLAGATIDDFERADPALAPTGDAKMGCTVRLVQAPDGSGSGSGQALQIAWPAQHGRWVECSYHPPRPTLAVSADQPQQVGFKLWAEGYCGITSISIRFMDASGESFQWRTPLPEPGRTGWRSVSATIDWAKPSTHWGGDNDAVIDWPVRFQGYAFEFDRPTVPASAIVLDDVQMTPSPTPSAP